MECVEPAGSVIIRGTVLGVLKEITNELKVKFNPNFAVVNADDGFAITTTVPTSPLMLVLLQTWADGWLTRHQNTSL